jgi:peptidyl-dipeptidase Dcp
MNYQKLIVLICAIGTTAVHSQNNKLTMNPFFEPYNTPFNVPPFDRINNSHYMPAIEEGIRQHDLEIEKIANSTDAPTFENTILAMEMAGRLLGDVNRVFSNMNSANTNEELQDIAKKLSPKLSAHNDNIFLNEKLFKRVQTVWDNKDKLSLSPEQSKLLEKQYKAFVRSGAKLNPEQKQRLRAINSELSLTTLKYGQNVLAETNKFELVITDQKDLAGLPEDVINAAAATASAKGKSGKWVFTLSNSSVMPFLQYSSKRELRKKIWNAYQMRANNDDANDNKANAITLANLRGEKARMLGYGSHADYALEETMAKTSENAYKLLFDLWKPALEVAAEETKAIQEMMAKDGIKDKVQPYDWRYYTEKVRKQRFDLDEQQLKQYFSLDNVTNGVFTVTEKLYGLKFKKQDNIPVYHPDATAWEVTEADGTHVGILYMDFHARDSKRGGAWMTSYRSQTTEDGKRLAPVIAIVCNFPKKVGNDPVLLTFDEMTTYFHEFGHALHGLLSNVTYRSLSGTSVPRDFVELPSQIMENWAAEPEVLKMFAKHHKTGEVIPDALIKKLELAGTFDQGFATTEYLAAAILDMDYHTQTTAITTDANSFEAASMKKAGLPGAIIPRYRSTYFTHIFSGGYSAGYYSYIWSGVLDTDAFEAFKSTSLFDPKTAELFRTHVLERGGTADPMEMYKNFRGSEPSIQPLLRKRGLDKKPEIRKPIKG